MFRSTFYNEGDAYRLIPVGRQMVVPGQSAALDVSVMWETPPLTQQCLSGGIASMYAFYVPLRLLWSGWMDFIAQDGGTVPTTTTVWPQMFELSAAALPVHSFYRRAYKLIYNQYFGSAMASLGTSAWYADITTDTDTAVKPVRTTDQFVSHLTAQADAPDPTYVAAVAGAQATINLNEFRQAMRNAYSTRRADTTGDKYVDAILRMGCSLDWRVQMAPEFLGKVSQDIWPKRTRVTTATDTAKPVAYYSETMNLKVGRRFFAEHGMLVTVLCVRPHLTRTASGTTGVARAAPADAYANDLSEFWLGDNQTGQTAVNAGSISAGVADLYSPRFGYLHWGQNNQGLASDVATSGVQWCNPQVAASFQEALYPTWAFSPSASVRQNEVVAYSTYRSDGPSPVKKLTF
jgi:hypothetical protein